MYTFSIHQFITLSTFGSSIMMRFKLQKTSTDISAANFKQLGQEPCSLVSQSDKNMSIVRKNSNRHPLPYESDLAIPGLSPLSVAIIFAIVTIFAVLLLSLPLPLPSSPSVTKTCQWYYLKGKLATGILCRLNQILPSFACPLFPLPLLLPLLPSFLPRCHHCHPWLVPSFRCHSCCLLTIFAASLPSLPTLPPLPSLPC